MSATGEIKQSEGELPNTSAATILSSEHGRMRRAQRMIDKRDLQAAIRYGNRVQSINARGTVCWKYTFADIIYITDITSTKEITRSVSHCL